MTLSMYMSKLERKARNNLASPREERYVNMETNTNMIGYLGPVELRGKSLVSSSNSPSASKSSTASRASNYSEISYLSSTSKESSLMRAMGQKQESIMIDRKQSPPPPPQYIGPEMLKS